MSSTFLFPARAKSSFDLFWEEADRTFGRYLPPQGENRPILAAWPTSEKPSPVTLSKLVQEFDLRGVLESTWAVQPVELRREGGSVTLVMADPGGEPLSRLVGTPLNTADFLDLAIAIATAVGGLHKSGLVHRDLKPGHILVAPSHQHVWLTGFGNTSPVPRDIPLAAPSSEIVGTLAYLSPEQTGHMNRPIDTRSDLYSIGVTFYQMLTGVLPFHASEPKDWVHSHLARQPHPPAERTPTVPGVLSNLVMRLLAKSADERYQTAAGLKADLLRCHSAWHRSGSIDDFELGEHDLADALAFPQRLYGRDRELSALLEAWRRVEATGHCELVLVSGYSGAGKTSVVQELQQVVGGGPGIFASGKAEQHDEQIPYATLAHALGGVLRQPALRLAGHDDWRKSLASAVAPGGALLAPLLPELEQFLGTCSPICELRPGEAERRLQAALASLIAVLARHSAPLTIFLDDVQWLDEQTIAFIQRLVLEGGLSRVLFVCAYRKNEVDAQHQLLASAQNLRSAGHTVGHIELADLDGASLGQLLADTLHCSAEDSAALARLVKECTGGNPFFVIQFLTELAEEGILRLDHGMGRWTWDLKQIRRKGFTDNIVELMLSRIARLHGETRDALQLLACLGNDTNLANLRRAWTGDVDAIDRGLWDAIRAGLVVRHGTVLSFRHDRIHEAVYGCIPDPERQSLHLRIGHQLAATIPPEQFDENVFVIVEQFNRAAKLVRLQSEKERLAELNLSAAIRAKAVSAYSTGLHYLRAAEKLLDPDARARRFDLAFSVAQHMAECEFQTGQLELAEARLSGLAENAADIRQLARITQLQLELLLTVGRREEAVSVGLQYLNRTGVQWSSRPSAEIVELERAAMWRQIGDRPIERLAEHRAMDQAEILGTMSVLVALMQPAWYSDDNLRRLVILRMVNLSVRYGNSIESGLVYGWLSMLLIAEPGGAAHAIQFARVALTLASRRGKDRYAARIFQIIGGNVLHWSQPLPASRELLDKALEITRATHNFTYAAYIHSNCISQGLAQGESLGRMQAAMEASSPDTWGGRYGLVKDRIGPRMQLVRTLRGQTPVFGSFDCEDFDEATFEVYLQRDVGRLLTACWYWIRKLQARYLAGDYGVAVACARNAEALMWTSPAYLEQAEYHFYSALATAAAYDKAKPSGQVAALDILRGHHRQLQTWAEQCPSTFSCRAALVGAEIARIEGSDTQAMHGYEAAIASARDNDFVHIRAIANELAARFYLQIGLENASRGYLLEARHCYAYWGADAKVWQIDALYPGMTSDFRRNQTTGTIDAPVKHLDLATVIAVSQSVAGEVSLDRLIEMLIRTAIEQAGASRGVLILPSGTDLRLAAEARVEGSEIGLQVKPRQPGAGDVPLSLIREVMEALEHTVIDDAFVPDAAGRDPYFQLKKIRSVLCLPLLNQAKLVGVLYLENEHAPRVFVPARTEVVKLLAFQAATALENSRLNEERVRADAALRQAHGELAHVSRVMTMNALASSIAHEVSQPLAATLANASAAIRWLNRETPNLAEVGESLTAIAAQAQRASDVITGMRSMLRKTSGEKTRLDVNAVIEQTLVLIDGEAARHRCVIEADLSTNLPQVYGDRVQLQQVILNLVMNGLESMHDTDASRRILSVRTESSDDAIVVAITDNGVGLEDGASTRLFDPFFTTKSEGLGMGLSISLSIVESHGGRLWAAPHQPRGTVFSFTLPMANVQDARVTR